MICSITIVALRSTASFSDSVAAVADSEKAFAQRALRSSFLQNDLRVRNAKECVLKKTVRVQSYRSLSMISVAMTELTTRALNRVNSLWVVKIACCRLQKRESMSRSQARSTDTCSATLLFLYWAAVWGSSKTSCVLGTPRWSTGRGKGTVRYEQGVTKS